MSDLRMKTTNTRDENKRRYRKRFGFFFAKNDKRSKKIHE